MQINKVMVAMITIVGLLLVGGIIEASGTQLGEGELAHDDGEVDSQCSIGDIGQAVFFPNDGKLNIWGIKICGARSGDTTRMFDIEIWDNNLKTLYSASYDYTAFFPDAYPPRMDNSDLKWVTIDAPNIEVTDNFYIAIFTYSRFDSGIVIGRDSDTKSGNSFVVDKNPNRILDWETSTSWSSRQDNTDWMIRVVTAQGTPASKTIYVDDDFTDDPINHKWNTIGEGIEDADSGDTIIVKSGRYPEHLEVDKQVTLRGEEYPVVDAGGSGSAITLSESGIILEGFVAINSEDAGIKVTTNDNIVRGNRANSNKWGIRIYSSCSNRIEDNTASSNSYDGIHLLHSEYNTIISNNVSNNYKDGIQLYSSSSNKITGNKVNKNDYVGIRLHSSTYNTIKGNDVGNNHGGGIEIKSSSHNNKIYHNNIIDNGREFQAYDDGNNQWDNGTEGNYWSDYSAKYPDAKEKDESGIWNTPYEYIGDYETNEKSGAKDNYPLMGSDASSSTVSADFTISPSPNIDLGNVITFDASLSTGNIVSYEWCLGDEAFCNGDFTRIPDYPLFPDPSEPIAKNLYMLPGTYQVTLKVEDISGKSKSVTKTVNVDSKYSNSNLKIYLTDKSASADDIVYTVVIVKTVPLSVSVQKYSDSEVLLGVNIGSAVHKEWYEYLEDKLPGMLAENCFFFIAEEFSKELSLIGKISDAIEIIDFIDFCLDPGCNLIKAGETSADMDLVLNIPYESAKIKSRQVISGGTVPDPDYSKIMEDIVIADTFEFEEISRQLIYVNKSEIGLSEKNRKKEKLAYIKKINPLDIPESLTFYYEPLKKEETVMSSLPKLKISVKREIYSHSPVLKPKHLKDVPLIGVPIRIDGKDIGSTSSGGVLEVTEEDLNDFGISPFGSHSLEAGDGIFYNKKTMQFDFTNEGLTKVDIVLDKYKLPDTPSYATIINESPINYPDLVIYPHAKSIENFINNKGILAEDLHVYMVDRTTKSIISGSDWVVVLCHSENIDKDYKLYSPGGSLFSVDSGSKKPLRSGSGWQIIRYDNKSGDTGDIFQRVFYIVYSEDKTEVVETAVKEFFEIMAQELGPSGTPVESSSGEGMVYFDTGTATIENLIAVNVEDMPEAPPSDVNLHYGLFRFDIADLPIGESVTLTLTFPDSLPAGTAYWKYGKTQDNPVDHWYEIPVGDDDGDNIITITLTDGGLGDDDLTANGVIVDDGGPGTMKASSAQTPGFEAVFVIVGLLTTAYLLRKKG